MWGTIVNFAAVLLGGTLGTLIKRGFSRKVVVAGIIIILLLSAAVTAGMILYESEFTLLIPLGGAASVLIWILMGHVLKNGLPKTVNNIMMQGIGLSVVIIGVKMAFDTENIILVIMCLVVGGILGEFMGIEDRLNRFGDWVQSRLNGSENSTFSEGFVNASLIFCVGAFAIVGSLKAGLQGDYTTLYAKATLDGITSIVLASTLGMGVSFSAFAILFYQGIITLSAGWLEPFLSIMVINEMSAVGGILILGIGLSLLNIKKFNIGNMLPAVFIPPIYFPLAELIKNLLIR